MRNAGIVLIILGGIGVSGAGAQVTRTTKKEQIYQNPREVITKKLKRSSMSDDEFNGYLWSFARDTMPSDVAIRKNVRRSEETPFWSRRSVWADATIPWRSAEFGTGKYATEALQRPTLEDRIAASQLPERGHANKEADDAVLAAVYRHFFDYRIQGFGRAAHAENVALKCNDVYFVGLGPHIADVSPSLLAALQNDPNLKRDKIVLRPFSKILEVTDEAIRDRDTGAYGPAFRIDDIGPVKDGEIKVLATFTEREGFWFSREFTLRWGKSGWEVAADADYALR